GEPQLRAQSTDQSWIDFPLWQSRAHVIRSDCHEPAARIDLDSGACLSQSAVIQNCCRAHLDSGAGLDVLDTAESQDRAGPADSRGGSGGSGAGVAEVHQPAHLAIAEGEAAERVWPILYFGNHHTVELFVRDDRAGGRGMVGAGAVGSRASNVV